MESAPPLAPQERIADLEPSKPKARWNWFEMFKKRQSEKPQLHTETNEVKKSKDTKKAESVSPASERQRFAADIIMLLRTKTDETKKEALPDVPASPAEQPAIEQMPKSKNAELQVTPESAVHPPIIERAKEMGHSVLHLIERAKNKVEAADRHDHAATQTDTEPLLVADADVRAAMRELIAPIEEYEAKQRESVTVQTKAQPEKEKPSLHAVDSEMQTEQMSGDTLFEKLLPQEEVSPLSRPMEVATAVASVAALEVLQAKERYERQSKRIRKVGLFALGGAVVGGFAYTWRRMRKLKKEQREMTRAHKKFESEVYAAQANDQRRLDALEATNVQLLTQPERQQYVHSVSEFAHTKAREIRRVAHAEIALPASGTSEQKQTQKDYIPPRLSAAERNENSSRPHKGEVTSENNSFVERLHSAVGIIKKSAIGASVDSAVSAGTKITSVLSAGRSYTKAAASQKAKKQPEPYYGAHQWILNAILVCGIVVFLIVLAFAIL